MEMAVDVMYGFQNHHHQHCRHRGHHQRMNQKGDQSRVIIKLEEQVHAFASTKLQKEIYSCHNKPYFEVPSWQKMTVAVCMT
jgi:hypothetical protein